MDTESFFVKYFFILPLLLAIVGLIFDKKISKKTDIAIRIVLVILFLINAFFYLSVK